MRPARAADLGALAEIERRVLPPGWSEEELREFLRAESSLCLVAVRQDRVVGSVLYRSVLDEAELLRLAVLRHHRRRGVAGELLQAAEGGLRERGVAHCHLEVRADNLAARSFYERSGWSESGRRPGYYPDGVDAVLMDRRLES